MRFIAGLIIAGLIGWCGWWFIGSSAQKSAWTSWFEERNQAGWVAENSGISVKGFPNRFDTTISDFELADTQSGWAWSAPFFQILMLSYQPNHVIAVWPNSHKISTPEGTVAITSEKMRGSVKFVPNTDLTFDGTQIEMQKVGLKGPLWEINLENANLATRRVEAGDAPDFAHQIGFNANKLNLSEVLKQSLDPADLLPAAIDKAHLDITVAFDAPWDRFSIDGPKPQPTAISVKDVNVIWGKLKFSANGQLRVDGRGNPEGDINLKAENWQDLVNLAASSGLISQDIAATITSGLRLMAALSGDSKTLSVPLNMSGGVMRLGPIRIGQAPNLTIK